MERETTAPDEAKLIRKEARAGDVFYSVLCGHPSVCPSKLGELRQPFGLSGMKMSMRNVPVAEARRVEPAAWILSHPSGYRCEGDAYHIIKDRPVAVDEHGRLQRRRGLGGARPVPKTLQTAAIRHQGGYAIIGEHPPLPAVIVCPRCHRRQMVHTPVDGTGKAAL